VAAVLACRAESTRLYGKPLQLVGDRPILDHLIDRLRRCRRITEIALAISDTPSQASFIAAANRLGLRYTIGSEQDVLGRMIECATQVGADTVVRVTTENPYVYWDNVDEMIDRHHATGAVLTVTVDLPYGSGIEVVQLSGWREVHAEGTERNRTQAPSEFFTERPDRFVVNRVVAPAAVAAPDLRLTVDSPEDLMVVRAIWDALHREGTLITLEEIVTLLRRRPEIAALNAHLRGPYVWHSRAAHG
jgi:spore coat polysaccharide biosynthesis protein SpsF